MNISVLSKNNASLTAPQVASSFQNGAFVGYAGSLGRPSVDLEDRIACRSVGLYPRDPATIRFQGCQLNRRLSR